VATYTLPVSYYRSRDGVHRFFACVLDISPFKIGPIGYPEISLKNYSITTLRSFPEVRRSHRFFVRTGIEGRAMN
jgi:hypothetical protein